MAIWPRRLGRR